MYTPEPENFWQQLEYSSVGDYIAVSTWAFPTLETIHVIALVTVVGFIAIMDMRLLGIASKHSPITEMSRDTLPVVWGAFVLAAASGLLLFISKASSYVINPYFLIKMGLLALAGVNMLFFHFVTYRQVANWDTAADVPQAVKVAGATSLIFWVAIVFFGRAIGFTLSYYF